MESRDINWVRTLLLSLFRCYTTGLVISAALSFHSGVEFGTIMFLPFLWVAVALPLSMAFHFLCIHIRKLMGEWARIPTSVAALITCLGDPVVYALNRVWPELFHAPDLRPFNLQPVILVHDSDAGSESAQHI